MTLVDEASPEAAIAAAVLMSAPVRAPILVSGEDGMPAVSAEALAALDPGGSGSTGGASVFAIGDGPDPDRVRDPAGRRRRERRRAPRRSRSCATGSSAPRPRTSSIAPLGEPAFAIPAAAWAARSGDPVLFAGRKELPTATARALRRHPQVPAYVLGPSSAISSDVLREVAAIVPAGAPGRRRGPGRERDRAGPLRGRRLRLERQRPRPRLRRRPRRRSRSDAAAAAPLSASGTWGPLLLTDDAGTLPAALRGYLLDVKPGYTEDPTRAFYNHVWVIGDQEAIEVGQQAEIDSLAELAKIGGN